jgi:hypothetical protein
MDESDEGEAEEAESTNFPIQYQKTVSEAKRQKTSVVAAPPPLPAPPRMAPAASSSHKSAVRKPAPSKRSTDDSDDWSENDSDSLSSDEASSDESDDSSDSSSEQNTEPVAAAAGAEVAAKPQQPTSSDVNYALSTCLEVVCKAKSPAILPFSGRGESIRTTLEALEPLLKTHCSCDKLTIILSKAVTELLQIIVETPHTEGVGECRRASRSLFSVLQTTLPQLQKVCEIAERQRESTNNLTDSLRELLGKTQSASERLTDALEEA